MTVTTDNGKYTFIMEPGLIKVLRYGNPWHEWKATDQGFKAIASLICELADA